MTRQNQTIDLLRFLAAFAVCLFHFNEPLPKIENWYRELVKFGWVGVPIFFVISGFCIEMTIKNSTATQFFIRRIFRIYPLYWFSLIVVLSVIFFQKFFTGYNSIAVLPRTSVEVMAHISLFIDPINKITGINWVYWSLVCEMYFYIIVFFSLLLYRHNYVFLLFLVTILSLLIFPLEKGHFLYPFKEWPAFALGMGLFRLTNTNKISFINISFFLLNVAGLIIQHTDNSGFIYIAVTLVTIIIIYYSNIRDIKENIFSKLGKYSYSIYLLHVPIGIYLINTILEPTYNTSIYMNIICNLAIYIAILLISKPVYRKIEMPFTKIGKRISNSHSY